MQKIEHQLEILGIRVNLLLEKDNADVFFTLRCPFLEKTEKFSKDKAILELEKALEWLKKS